MTPTLPFRRRDPLARSLLRLRRTSWQSANFGSPTVSPTGTQLTLASIPARVVASLRLGAKETRIGGSLSPYVVDTEFGIAGEIGYDQLKSFNKRWRHIFLTGRISRLVLYFGNVDHARSHPFRLFYGISSAIRTGRKENAEAQA